ncbi:MULTISPECIES: NADH-quinone oxidoreductase subunit NuoH [Desulfosporosinus]|uniref:NADH-quinone oxidoreductase subunit H n=1 Tax=Desulfosporosinus nitroreducens TaxID=2018668 RepID=A0ABT8QVI7_9FIRM|nr:MULTISPECIES: NADH-quinone oxidoreductase subunit NuoH [Desulfosporosinus]MDA8221862.1 NADH-quinone oxidoreductase subunit NuoH [Desulfitobacterium hafniense]MDO0825190.1 NADH-quinone oxidoreductase subunit NuoH [Desulfosporosinus nitroreducens]
MDALNNLFVNIAAAIRGLFADSHSFGADLSINIIVFIMLFLIMVVAALFLSLVERKFAHWVSQRSGPNRLGPHGWFQFIADAVKMLGKEDITPANVDKFLFKMAPMMLVGVTLMVFGVIPFGEEMVAIDLDLGILYFFSVSSLTTLGILMAGWASNNKYSLLGGLRAVAQMISYEIPLIFSLLGVVMITQTFNLSAIIEAQKTIPFIFLQPLAFLIFLIAGIAETNRAPFDHVQGEQEIVAGPFTEYSGLRWGLFMLAEYGNVVATSAIAVTMFLGGWYGPEFLPGWLWFILKIWLVIFLMMWVRWTFVRMRIDHLMHFAWKILLPLALVNIFLTGLGIYVYDLFIARIGG